MKEVLRINVGISVVTFRQLNKQHCMLIFILSSQWFFTKSSCGKSQDAPVLKKVSSIRCVLVSMIFNPTYLFVLIKCGAFASAVALFHDDKARECGRSACHHEKQSAAQDKGQIHSNYCTLNMRVYAPIFLLCFNLGCRQIEGIIDGCNYKKIVKLDYWLMLHI